MNAARDTLRPVLSALSTSASALAAVTAALNARASGRALPPGIDAHVREVLDALGVRGPIDALPSADLCPVLGELSTFAASDARLAAIEPPLPGWSPTDPRALQAAGDVSAELPRALAERIAPELDGLSAQLAGTASFLDVGVGVGALSIQMATLWPSLRVVGVEPWLPALERARHNVRQAGLDARIELRAQGGEALTDEHAFDLAWVPSLFIPAAAIDAVVERVRRALRPGAWLLMAVLAPHDGGLAARVVRLRTALWGGCGLDLDGARDLLTHADFTEVRPLAARGPATTLLVAAQAPR